MERFPCDFLIGAATAAHQVEGNNIHSDAWAEEHMKHTTYLEPSGAALDHYHRYEEDIRMMAAAGLNAYRFSIEWARIEPEEGLFDNDELEHYRRVIACCRDNGVEPVITLLHFTSPKWLIARGGWEADTTVAYFSRYVRYVMEHLGSELHYVCTINEANMGVEIADIAQRYAQQIQAARQGSNSLQLGFDLDHHAGAHSCSRRHPRTLPPCKGRSHAEPARYTGRAHRRGKRRTQVGAGILSLSARHCRRRLFGRTELYPRSDGRGRSSAGAARGGDDPDEL